MTSEEASVIAGILLIFALILHARMAVQLQSRAWRVIRIIDYGAVGIVVLILALMIAMLILKRT